MKGRLKLIVINHLVRHLLKAISEEDILHRTSQGWFVNKRKLERDELTILRDEAEILKDSQLWKLMQKELTWLANLRMFEHSRTAEDLTFGKAMLYNQDLGRKFLDRLTKL